MRPFRDTRSECPDFEEANSAELRVDAIEAVLNVLRATLTNREGDAGEDELQEASELVCEALAKARRAAECSRSEAAE